MNAKHELSDNSKEEDRDSTTLIVCGVPEELKIRFKLSCVRRGLSMSEVLVEAIRRIVEQSEDRL